MPKKQPVKSRRSPKGHGPLDPASGCVYARFSFLLPRDQFDTTVFWRLSEESGAEPGTRNWAAIVPPKVASTNYHVHFSGSIERDAVKFVVGYYGGAPESLRGKSEPYSESMMAWLSKMVPSNIHAEVFAEFSKSSKKWKSRFNLPFRVTMADREVGIDGVSLDLPENEYGANSALLLSSSDYSISIRLSRQLDLKTFALATEIKNADAALTIFMEKKA